LKLATHFTIVIIASQAVRVRFADAIIFAPHFQTTPTMSRG
jgi:hypothetical protein